MWVWVLWVQRLGCGKSARCGFCVPSPQCVKGERETQLRGGLGAVVDRDRWGWGENCGGVAMTTTSLSLLHPYISLSLTDSF